ncbi:MAG: RNA polymerase sigma-70 factor [Ginsengibacter sp.]
MTEAVYFKPGYQTVRIELNDEGIISLLAKRDEKIFEQVFKTHFKSLHAYAFTIVKDDMLAEELVQNIFFKLWERSEKLTISGSIAAYLYRAVYNECLNYFKHMKVRTRYQSHAFNEMKNQTDSASKKVLLKELELKLHEALRELPEQCRTIFQLSRFEELKYREIADKLDISPKTVENQMGKALRLLRMKLIDFLPLTTFLMLIFNYSD